MHAQPVDMGTVVVHAAARMSSFCQHNTGYCFEDMSADGVHGFYGTAQVGAVPGVDDLFVNAGHSGSGVHFVICDTSDLQQRESLHQQTVLLLKPPLCAL